MLILLFFQVLYAVIYALTFWLPSADELPWGIDSIVVLAVSYFKAFIEIFPPLGIVLEAFLLYLGFRLGMLVLRLFIGHRAPVTN